MAIRGLAENVFFLGIGAQKAGTSYLYSCLSEHPQILMPPIKELHWFDEAQERCAVNPFHRLINWRHPRNKRWAKVLLLSSGQKIVQGHFRKAMWIWRFMMLRRELTEKAIKGYVSATRGYFQSSVTGDITPFYAALKPDTIKFIHQNLPDVKIVYLIRNPFERDMSELRMYVRDNQISCLSEIPDEYLERWRSDRFHSQYLKNLKHWVSFFGLESIHVELFDCLVENPQATLDRIFTFLGLPTHDIAEEVVSRVVNNSPPLCAIPDTFYLPTGQYSDEIRSLKSYLRDWPHVPIERLDQWMNTCSSQMGEVRDA